MKIYIYEDKKYDPIMVYAKREYPYGKYLGHFKTKQEAQQEIEKYQKNQKAYEGGIPLCDALINFQKDHGGWNNEGLTLLQEVEL